MKGYRLKIQRLDFISAVDAGAQGPVANVALIKRAPRGGIDITCKVAKLEPSLGLVFGWAMAGTTDGGKTDHVDLQSDAIEVNTDDFIKACAEFMEQGAASDVMHDGSQDGRIVFAMPLVKQVNDALGIKSDVQGLAIAMKPSPETFKRFVSGELNAFSIGGVGERSAIKSAATGKCTAGHDMPVDVKKCATCGAKQAYKRLDVAKFADGSFRVMKESVLTSETDGHVHAIDIDDPSTCWMDMYSTSYQTLEGADNGHSHSWTFDRVSGVITIGADSGHEHTVAAVVPPDALAAYAAIDAARDAENLAVPTPIADEESSGKVSVTIISARNSTPLTRINHGDHMDELKKQLAEAVAKLADIAKHDAAIAKMSPAHRAHHATLTAGDAEGFLAKSDSDRDAALAAIAKRDEIVYTSKSTGDVYRTKDDPRLIEMAKRMDAQAEDVEKSAIATIAKSHLGTLAGDDEVHQYIIASCRKGGADAAKLEKVFTAMKGWNALGTAAAKAKGVNPGSDAQSPDKASAYDALSKGLVTFAKANKIEKVWTEGLDAFIATPEGAALHAAYENAKKAA